MAGLHSLNEESDAEYKRGVPMQGGSQSLFTTEMKASVLTPPIPYMVGQLLFYLMHTYMYIYTRA